MIPDLKISISRRVFIAASALLLAPRLARAEAFSWTGLAGLEESSGARIGVAAIDTGNGRAIAWRESERFVMCSSFKLSLAAAILQRTDQGAEKLDRLG